ncbi:transposable element Tcb2 transposase [Trichonephila clavipes]|nr:transposable element Tcb2 transposase [Trichonephila clavipes]
MKHGYPISPRNQSNSLWNGDTHPLPSRSKRKIMARVYWDRRGVLLVDFMPQGTTINSGAYCATFVELLGDHLHPFMLFCYPRGNRVFQQDNYTSHKFLLATSWLDVHSSDFSVVNRPPRSPDLNPIDHLWAIWEQDVKGHLSAPMNLTELWTALANIWEVIPVENFQKLVEYMPSCVVARSKFLR